VLIVAELETGAAAEVATTPILLKADIEAEELVIARVAGGAEEVVVVVRPEDVVESVDEDAAEASRTIHRRHH
jgi:hypothetical protein